MQNEDEGTIWNRSLREDGETIGPKRKPQQTEENRDLECSGYVTPTADAIVSTTSKTTIISYVFVK
jgi:hypothetical protein